MLLESDIPPGTSVETASRLREFLKYNERLPDGRYVVTVINDQHYDPNTGSILYRDGPLRIVGWNA